MIGIRNGSQARVLHGWNVQRRQGTGQSIKDASNQATLLDMTLVGLGGQDGRVNVDILITLLQTATDVILDLPDMMLFPFRTGCQPAESKGREDLRQWVENWRIVGLSGDVRLSGEKHLFLHIFDGEATLLELCEVTKGRGPSDGGQDKGDTHLGKACR